MTQAALAAALDLFFKYIFLIMTQAALVSALAGKSDDANLQVCCSCLCLSLSLTLFCKRKQNHIYVYIYNENKRGKQFSISIYTYVYAGMQLVRSTWDIYI